MNDLLTHIRPLDYVLFCILAIMLAWTAILSNDIEELRATVVTLEMHQP